MKTKIKNLMFSLLFVFLFIAISDYVEAFGISPSKLFLSNNEEEYFYIYNNEGVVKNFSLFSNDDYLIFNESIIAKPNNITRISIKIKDLALDLQDGIYKTKIYVAEKSFSSGVILNKALAVLIEIQISNDKISSNKSREKDFKTSLEDSENINDFEKQKNSSLGDDKIILSDGKDDFDLKIIGNDKKYIARNPNLEFFQILLLLISLIAIFGCWIR